MSHLDLDATLLDSKMLLLPLSLLSHLAAASRGTWLPG